MASKIEYYGTDEVSGNTIYGNTTAIGGDLRNYGYSAIVSGMATIENNLIYGNTGCRIDFNSGTGVVIDNNTIEQAGAPAIDVVGYANNETIENNVLIVSGAPAITVDASSESGIDSDYNLFDLTAGGTVGQLRRRRLHEPGRLVLRRRRGPAQPAGRPGADQRGGCGRRRWASPPATAPPRS